MKKTVLVVVVLFTMLGCSDESDMGKLFMKKTEGLTFGIERYYVKIIGGTPMVIKFNGDICSHPDELKVIGHTEDQLKLEGVFIPEYIGGRPPKNTTFVINIFLKVLRFMLKEKYNLDPGMEMMATKKA